MLNLLAPDHCVIFYLLGDQREELATSCLSIEAGKWCHKPLIPALGRWSLEVIRWAGEGSWSFGQRKYTGKKELVTSPSSFIVQVFSPISDSWFLLIKINLVKSSPDLFSCVKWYGVIHRRIVSANDSWYLLVLFCSLVNQVPLLALL